MQLKKPKKVCKATDFCCLQSWYAAGLRRIVQVKGFLAIFYLNFFDNMTIESIKTYKMHIITNRTTFREKLPA